MNPQSNVRLGAGSNWARFRRFGWLLTIVIAVSGASFSARADEGVALAIVYDTSGSMNDAVMGKSGRGETKDVIARRALDALVVQLAAFVTNAPAGTKRALETSVYVFSSTGAKELVPPSPFDAAKAANWSKEIPKPSGGTPLGTAAQAGARTVMNSKFNRRHVLILTDGLNTVGPAPEALLAPLMKQAEKDGKTFFAHFVAFDVAAKQFDPVKKLGATVLGAANEVQLNSQISFILEEKILLEAEDPKPKK
jgi:hypothetical protein